MLKRVQQNEIGRKFAFPNYSKSNFSCTKLHQFCILLHSIVGLTLVNQTLFFFGRLKSTLPATCLFFTIYKIFIMQRIIFCHKETCVFLHILSLNRGIFLDNIHQACLYASDDHNFLHFLKQYQHLHY